MKKAIVLFLILALTVPMLCFSAKAEEYFSPWDARNVPDEVAELLPDYEKAQIVYKYYLSLPYPNGIGSIESVEQRMTAEATPYYMVVTADVEKRYRIENGKAVEHGWSDPNCVSNEMLTYEAICAVAPDICIESVYCCIASDYGTADLTILYKTNLGDYVYFATEQTPPMLMTVRRYDEYTVARKQYNKEMVATNGGLLGGRYVLHIDSSSYDWTSPNFNPDAPLPIEKNEPDFLWLIVGIGAVVLAAAAAVTTVLIIRKKKKKTAPEEMELTPEET